MSIENHDQDTADRPEGRTIGKGSSVRRIAALGIVGAVVLGIGAAGGAAAMRYARHDVELAPLSPVAISTLKDDQGIVTVKGRVAEIYGNKFIVQDDSGRALIETGPAGDDGALVKVDEPLSVQGRFDRGFVHASFIVHQDGKTDTLRVPPHPPRGPIEDALRRLKP